MVSDAPAPAGDHHDDLALAQRCGRGEREALLAFEARVVPAVAATAARFGDADLVAEVVQAVRQRLLVGTGEEGPKILEYQGRGPLVSFAQASAVRLALTLLARRRQAPPPLDDEALFDTPAGDDSPELVAIKQRFRGEFKAAFAAAAKALDEVLRSALKLYYLDGLTLADLGSLYGWSVPTASRRIAEARAQLLAGTRRALTEQLALSPTELDSVLRLLDSRLSVEGLLG